MTSPMRWSQTASCKGPHSSWQLFLMNGFSAFVFEAEDGKPSQIKNPAEKDAHQIGSFPQVYRVKIPKIFTKKSHTYITCIFTFNQSQRKDTSSSLSFHPGVLSIFGTPIYKP